MYCDSYNQVSHIDVMGDNKIEAEYRDDTGKDFVGNTCRQGYIYRIDGVQSSTGWDYYTAPDTLDYIKYGGMYAGENGSKTESWLLSSPSAVEGYVCEVYGWNASLHSDYFGYGQGLCPLVSLKSTFIPQISATN